MTSARGMSSSLKLSSTSIKKGTGTESKEETSSTGANRRLLSPYRIACLLLVLSALSLASYLVTMPPRPEQEPVVATLVDDDDEAASHVDVRARPRARTLLPTHRVQTKEATRASTTEATTVDYSDSETPENVTILMDAPRVFPAAEPGNPCASKARFSACTPNSHHEFFYDAKSEQCRSKTRELPPPCPAGVNRFKSFRDCRLACMDQVPEDRCSVPPLFRRCTAKDIVRQWWYLKGGTCHSWNFSNSNCVSPRLALFERQEDCHNLCVAGNPAARHPGCSETPVEHICTALHMVYPVLARRVEKRITCVQVDPSEPKCLMSPNRFYTEVACRKICLH